LGIEEGERGGNHGGARTGNHGENGTYG